MNETWGDIFKEFGKESGMPHEYISDWRPCTPPFYDLEIPNTIVIWLKNAGKILYTPKKKEQNSRLENVMNIPTELK